VKNIFISSWVLFSLLWASLFLASPAFAGDPFSGSNLYVLHCASCHGGDGRGEIAGTPSFRGGRLMSMSDSDLKNTVRTGRNLMPSFRGLLEEYQIDDVVSYIRTFN
jgi:cytochrome c6